MVAAITNGTSGMTSHTSSGTGKIDPQEFLKIMIKEMQQQDPFEPMSSKDMITQVGQIQGIQSSMDLSKTLKDLSLSQKLGSAGNLLGKEITGLNDSGETVSGLVTTVKREGDRVYLELDGGQRLEIANVVSVNNPTPAPATNTTTAKA